MLPLIILIVSVGLISENNSCKGVGGEYNVVKGCSVETFPANERGMGFPKSLMDIED